MRAYVEVFKNIDLLALDFWGRSKYSLSQFTFILF